MIDVFCVLFSFRYRLAHSHTYTRIHSLGANASIVRETLEMTSLKNAEKQYVVNFPPLSFKHLIYPFVQTIRLRECMLEHREYYAPLLEEEEAEIEAARKAAEAAGGTDTANAPKEEEEPRKQLDE